MSPLPGRGRKERPMPGKRRILILGLFLAVLVLPACAGAGAKAKAIAAKFGGTYETAPSLEKKKPRTIAVLPFEDSSGSKEGAAVVRRGFYNHFSSLNYQDMEFFRIDQLLAMNGLADPKALAQATPQRLGEILKVDAVVRGKVSDFDKLFAVIYSDVAVGAEVEMLDTKTGEKLWSARHTVHYRAGGIPTSIGGLIGTVFSTAMNVRDIQLFRACDDLFRDMVKTIPEPAAGEARRPPEITLLVDDTGGKPRKAGDRIQVGLRGTPNMTAWAVFGEDKLKFPLEEKEPGEYIGVYTVRPGDNIEDALVTGHLSDPAGNESSWVAPLGSITLDTTPPAAPTGLSATGRDGGILLKWNRNAEADLAAYRVYESSTPLTGFAPLSDTEFSRLDVKDRPNFAARYYKVTALDRAGNESRPSAVTEGVAVAPGPTRVSGAINADTVWRAGAGPYVLDGEVTVGPDATLLIQPGTQVVSKGGALVVKGRLDAPGTAEEIIVFSGEAGASWKGIVFDGAGARPSALVRCRVSGAEAAVTCLSASPGITACEIERNETGLRASGSFSHPRVRESVIRANRGAGVLVEKGAAPEISQTTITANSGCGIRAEDGAASVSVNDIHDNAPFDVAGPREGKPVSASGNFWGTADPKEVLRRISGRVLLESILDAPRPAGKEKSFPVLPSRVPARIAKDAFLLLAESPYRMSGEVILEGGALLVIQPGVEIRYESGASLKVTDGAVWARGTREAPIRFSSAAASPGAGDYVAAAQLSSYAASFFEYCVVRHAATGFNVEAGEPDIVRCHISMCSQRGIRTANDAAPRILYSTIEDCRGSGGIECLGVSHPRIANCNITGNAVGLQAMTSIEITATDNWWGTGAPDSAVIWGENVKFSPWLPAPSPEAFKAP